MELHMSICIRFIFWWQLCDRHISGTDYGRDDCKTISRSGISEPLHEELQIIGALQTGINSELLPFLHVTKLCVM